MGADIRNIGRWPLSRDSRPVEGASGGAKDCTVRQGSFAAAASSEDHTAKGRRADRHACAVELAKGVYLRHSNWTLAASARSAS